MMSVMPQKLPKCILHIGTPKSGTTTLQDFLKSNNDALAQQGFVTHRRLGSKLARGFTPWQKRTRFLRKSGLKSRTAQERLLQKSKEELATLVQSEQNSGKTLVLSCEHFYMMGSYGDALEEIRDFFYQHFETVEIICYFRDAVDYVPSGYCQNLRGAYTGSLAASIDVYLKSDRWRYFSNYQNWSAVFGPEHCQFIPYNPGKRSDFDIVEDFCSVVQFDHSNLFWKGGTRLNTKMSARMCQMYRLINIFVPVWKKTKGKRPQIDPRNKQFKAYVKDLKVLQGGKYLRLTEQQKERIRSVTQDEYEPLIALHNRRAEGEVQKQPTGSPA